MGEIYRFDVFELHTRPFQLRRQGEEVPLQPQPARALAYFASRAGELITREELRSQLWGDDVQLEYEQAINFTVRKIRSALGDSAQSPRFVETIPRQGYRFVAAVERLEPSESRNPLERNRSDQDEAPRRRWTAFAAAAALLAVALGLWLVAGSDPLPEEPPAVTRASAFGEGIGKLAVLPLEAQADDVEARALADVLSQELVARLASRLAPRRSDEAAVVSGLAVVTLRSARTLRGEPPEAAGRQLGADLVLSGTLVRESVDLRLSARLWRVDDRVNVWASVYDVARDEVDGVWDQIAVGVGDAVGLDLPPVPAPAPSPLSADQKTQLWQAQMLVQRKDLPSVELGIRRLEALAEAVPDAAEVHVALAGAWMAWSGVPQLPFGKPFADYFPQIEKAAQRALELDPESLAAWVHLAAVRFNHDQDWPEARRILEHEVLKRSPRHALGLHLYGILLGTIGRFDEGTASIRRAVELDPVTLFTVSDLSTILLMSRRYDEAINQARRNLEIDPDDGGSALLIFEALKRQGRASEAVAFFQGQYDRKGAEPEAPSFEALLSPITGQLDALASEGHPAFTVTARYQMMLGDIDAGLGSLERACNEQPDYQLLWVAVDPAFDSVREHPRYLALGECLAPADADVLGGATIETASVDTASVDTASVETAPS